MLLRAAWTHQFRSALCVYLQFQDSKHPGVGELQREGPFLFVLCFCLFWMQDCAIALPKYTCAVFSCVSACSPASLRPSSERPPLWGDVLSKTRNASAWQLFWCSSCRYSYGKAVQGTMRVTLCQKARRHPQNASKDTCREYSGPVSKILEDTRVVKEHCTGQRVK